MGSHALLAEGGPVYRFNALLGGLIAGVLGAAVWAVVAAVTGYEIGWIAWGVGLGVGVGVAIGNRGEGSVPAGVLAALLATLSVVGGKYVMVRMVMPGEAELVAGSIAALENDELVVSYLADAVVDEFEARGRPVAWPDDAEPLQAAEQSDYPADVWAVAQERWDAMSPQDREAYRAERRANVQASAAAFHDMIAQQGFLHAFGLMDLIFFTLAVVTAFKIGRTGSFRERQAYA
jgi:hypothetical protein